MVFVVCCFLFICCLLFVDCLLFVVCSGLLLVCLLMFLLLVVVRFILWILQRCRLMILCTFIHYIDAAVAGKYSREMSCNVPTERGQRGLTLGSSRLILTTGTV